MARSAHRTRRIGLTVAVTALALSLGGCLPPTTQEYLTRHTQQDWESFKNTDWQGIGRKMVGLDQMQPTPDEKKVQDSEAACVRTDAYGRETTQNGVNDQIDYWQCPSNPAEPKLGERLAPRS